VKTKHGSHPQHTFMNGGGGHGSVIIFDRSYYTDNFWKNKVPNFDFWGIVKILGSALETPVGIFILTPRNNPEHDQNTLIKITNLSFPIHF
jgi:hypothetical protein